MLRKPVILKYFSFKTYLVVFIFGFLAIVFPHDLRAENPPLQGDAAPASINPPDSIDIASSTIGTPDDPNSITLDFKDADINTVLRVLSLKSRINIVAGPEVQGTVTIRLENVPWEKALEVVLRTYNYVYERSENIIRVTTREKMSQEPVVTQTYILNYTRAVEVQDAIKDMLTERGRIRIAERTNTLIVTDIPTNLYRLQEVIKKLDQRTAQAFIDSKVVNTSFGTAENLGIAWTPTVSMTGSTRPTTFPYFTDPNTGNESVSPIIKGFFPGLSGAASAVAANANDTSAFPSPVVTAASTYSYGTMNFTTFAAALEALKSRTDTKVVSNPRIVVLNNQKAKVQVGQQIPLPNYERNENTGSVEVTGFSYRDVGVVLNVTPHINSEEEILVELAPEISSTGSTIDFGDFQMPSFNVTQANTQVLIRSSETIAIGGLLTDNSQYAQAKVSLFGDLPLVGKFFRSKRQTPGSGNSKVETLFFITVTMVDTEGQPVGNRLEERKKRKQGGKRTVESAPKNTNKKTVVGESQQEAESAVVMDPVGPTQKKLIPEAIKTA